MAEAKVEEEPALARILTAMERVVEQAKRDPDARWRSGWFGNMVVNTWPEGNRGLCYEWRDRVYAGVLPTVRAVGWEAVGLHVNWGKADEHHGVLVFDPKRATRATVLSAPKPRHGFVLDAWRNGEAEVYTLDEWLSSPFGYDPPPRLKELGEAGGLGVARRAGEPAGAGVPSRGFAPGR
jgi:hypothetical protein